MQLEDNDARRVHLMNNYKIKRDQFETVFDPRRHEALRARGERRFTHRALLGTIMIMLYKEEPRCQNYCFENACFLIDLILFFSLEWFFFR